MLIKYYRKWIGRYIFRKMMLGIAFSLVLVFALLGYFTYSNYYKLLEEREQDLLNIRIENLYNQLDNMITQFKRETISLYPLNNQLTGSFTYFLPRNIPDSEDEQSKLSDRNYLSSLLGHMLERNSKAASIHFYREGDDKLFSRNRYPSTRLNDQFDFITFFSNIPKNYDYPYIGRLDHLYNNIDRPMLYLINPIYDINNIHYNKVLGYMMLCIDSKTLIDMFQPKQDSEIRLLIQQQDTILLDSHPQMNTLDLAQDGFLRHMHEIDNYNLIIIGIKNKSAILSKLSKITILIIVGLCLTWIVCLLLIHYIQKVVIRRLKLLTQHFKKLQTNPFIEPMEKAGDDEIGYLIDRFNRMTHQLQEHINLVYISEAKIRTAEYMALKMQINPHFLYNTLESLRMQAVINKQSILAEKLFNLGRLYRWILKSDAEEIPIEEELQYTRYYLDLFMMGKSKKIALEIYTDLDLNEHYIPKFSLQPIVENGIMHGELEKNQKPVIVVHIRIEGEFQIIEISNNGKGLEEEEQIKLNEMLKTRSISQHEHFGLRNINDRIRAYYGAPCGLFIIPTQQDQGFSVYMKLPKDKKSS